MKLYALLSGQGTACDEACLCDLHYTAANRAKVEAYVAKQGHGDPPIPETWTDCTENEACQDYGCQACTTN